MKKRILLAVFLVGFALVALCGGVGQAQQQQVASLNPTIDDTIMQAWPTSNYGTCCTHIVDGDEPSGSGQDSSALLKFDVPSVIPAGAKIQSASLKVNVTNSSVGGFPIYALKRDWSETGSDWNEASSGEAWEAAGATGANDREDTVLGTVSLNSLGWGTTSLNASGVAKVQQWLDTPSSNHGIVIAPDGSADDDDGLRFDIREAASEPVLEVTYAEAPRPPADPSGLVATSSSQGRIDLSWTDNATNEEAYTVERSTDGANFRVLNSTLPADTASYKDEGLSASTIYYYRVKATNAGGDSNYSNTAPATTLPPPAGLLFSDTFERDADTMVPPWDDTCIGPLGSVTTDPSISRKGTYSAKFNVQQDDCSLWGAPRANVRWSEHFCEGDERYIGYSMYLPADFPNPNPGWMNLGQFGYGPPWGYPPIHFSYWGDGTKTGMYIYDQNPTSQGNIPLRLGAWNDIVLHEYFSSDPSVGFVEVWKDGQPITFNNGSRRLHINTLRTDATECGSLDLQQYRQGSVWPEWLAVWFDEAKVGSSYAAVDPAAP